MTKVSAIVAIDQKRGIGKNGTIPWFIKGEQLRLKEITTPHPVIMGRKTYESIPDKFRPLSGRPNIVITRDAMWDPHEDITIVHSIEDALQESKILDDKEIFILGGAQIFNETIAITDRVYLTIIKKDYDCDTFFPEYLQFSKVIDHQSNKQNDIEYDYIILEKD